MIYSDSNLKMWLVVQHQDWANVRLRQRKRSLGLQLFIWFSPETIDKTDGFFVTHICTTREINAVFGDAYEACRVGEKYPYKYL